MAQQLVSVVIPSYDEMANLQKGILDKLKAYLDAQAYDYEVVVVDDGSTDGSREFVKAFAGSHHKFRIIENDHTGKAGAVTAGMLSARGNIILFTDMDQATPIEETEKLLPFIESGFDVVIGSRDERRGAPWSRKLMSKGNIVLRKLIVGLPQIKDTQCGFKMFTKAAAKDLFAEIKELNQGFKTIKNSAVTAGFDMELLYLATNKGYKIKEVPVTWLYVETRRVSPIKDSVEGVIDLIRIRSKINNGSYRKV